MIQASKQGGQHNHHGSGGSSASHRGNSRKRGQPVEIKFSRATERVNHSMSLQGDDSDEDSDLDDLGSGKREKRYSSICRGAQGN